MQGTHMVEDAETGLQGVIVIDSLSLGPAMGGCRFWAYASPSDQRLDAQRLIRGMSHKNALAGLPPGGGNPVLEIGRAAGRLPHLVADGVHEEIPGAELVAAS